MPEIKVKTEYIKKLRQLGVYDQWLTNVKAQLYMDHFSDPDRMHEAADFHAFLNWSFNWSKSPEGTIIGAK